MKKREIPQTLRKAIDMRLSKDCISGDICVNANREEEIFLVFFDFTLFDIFIIGGGEEETEDPPGSILCIEGCTITNDIIKREQAIIVAAN